MQGKTCSNCEHARQVGNKGIQNIVGCTRLLQGQIEIHDVTPLTSQIHEGYIYNCRRVGDVEESKTVEKGALILGYMTESSASCYKYEELKG